MSRHPKPETIHPIDGYRLAARLCAPGATAPCAVLIVPAMGVSQEYYADFVNWLALRGIGHLPQRWASGCAMVIADRPLRADPRSKAVSTSCGASARRNGTGVP